MAIGADAKRLEFASYPGRAVSMLPAKQQLILADNRCAALLSRRGRNHGNGDNSGNSGNSGDELYGAKRRCRRRCRRRWLVFRRRVTRTSPRRHIHPLP
jgi:hypothetical protein